ncbi:replication initiation protein [Micrococcus porci]
MDVDHEDALMRSLWNRHDWLPNAVVENSANGHTHAVWALAEPVTRTEYAARKPLAYAAAVTEGLRRSVDGDKAYSGLITKNPEHESWAASWTSDRFYSLSELAEHLDAAGFMPAPSWRRSRRRRPVGLGRNCAIFETARVWAYREIRHHWGEPEGLRAAIVTHVHELNAGFSEPLSHREALDIAHSIHRWITTCSRMWADCPVVYEATFSTIQAARGRKGGVKSAEKRRAVVQDRARLIVGEEA